MIMLQYTFYVSMKEKNVRWVVDFFSLKVQYIVVNTFIKIGLILFYRVQLRVQDHVELEEKQKAHMSWKYHRKLPLKN